jgi:hypothetical protein
MCCIVRRGGRIGCIHFSLGGSWNAAGKEGSPGRAEADGFRLCLPRVGYRRRSLAGAGPGGWANQVDKVLMLPMPEVSVSVSLALATAPARSLEPVRKVLVGWGGVESPRHGR